MTNEMRPPTFIKFGTDGWRAVIGEDYTFDNVRACAASVAMYLKKHGLADRGLIVGYDARYASEDFADAVAEVVAAQGIKVALTSALCPTPVVSYSIIDRKAGRRRRHHGQPQPVAVERLQVQARVRRQRLAGDRRAARRAAAGSSSAATSRRMEIDEAKARRHGRDVRPARRRTSRNSRGSIDLDRAEGRRPQRLLRRHVRHRRRLLQRAARRRQDEGRRSCTASATRSSPACTRRSRSPATSTTWRTLMAKGGFDVGIATDGDADRVGIADENGNFINQLQVFGAARLLPARDPRRARRDRQVDHDDGDGAAPRRDLRRARARDAGRLQVPRPEDDGDRRADRRRGERRLRLPRPRAGARRHPRRPLHARLHGAHRQAARASCSPSCTRRSARTTTTASTSPLRRRGPRRRSGSAPRTRRPDTVAGIKVTARDTTDGFRFTLGDKGWLLFRFSGTEPLVRIYTEVVGDESLVQKVLAAGRSPASDRLRDASRLTWIIVRYATPSLFGEYA